MKILTLLFLGFNEGWSTAVLGFLSWHCIEPLTPTWIAATINSLRNISVASLLRGKPWNCLDQPDLFTRYIGIQYRWHRHPILCAISLPITGMKTKQKSRWVVFLHYQEQSKPVSFCFYCGIRKTSETWLTLTNFT